MNNRKRAVSIRMNSADIGCIKKLAKRLGVRDSDVVRCAVKMMMSKLAPLADASMRGSNLVPVFVESGGDLFRHLDLDATSLEQIINEGASEEVRVDHDDIQLLAMNGVQRSYVKLRLNVIGNANGAHSETTTEREKSQRSDDSLREYLYEKYVYRTSRHEARSNAGEP